MLLEQANQNTSTFSWLLRITNIYVLYWKHVIDRFLKKIKIDFKNGINIWSSDENIFNAVETIRGLIFNDAYQDMRGELESIEIKEEVPDINFELGNVYRRVHYKGNYEICILLFIFLLF